MGQERGSISMIFLAGCWTVLLLGLAVAIDFGRFYLYKEQLQAAADSAALAAVMSTTKMVSVTQAREQEVTEYTTCTDPVTNLQTTCETTSWEPASDAYKEGTESVLWGRRPGSYAELCQWPYRCVGTPAWKCWLVPAGGIYGPAQAARKVFTANAQWNRFDNVTVTEPEIVYPVQSKWNWDEFQVQVNAELTMPTQFWGILGGRPVMKYRLKQPASAIPVRHIQGPPC